MDDEIRLKNVKSTPYNGHYSKEFNSNVTTTDCMILGISKEEWKD